MERVRQMLSTMDERLQSPVDKKKGKKREREGEREREGGRGREREGGMRREAG